MSNAEALVKALQDRNEGTLTDVKFKFGPESMSAEEVAEHFLNALNGDTKTTNILDWDS